MEKWEWVWCLRTEHELQPPAEGDWPHKRHTKARLGGWAAAGERIRPRKPAFLQYACVHGPTTIMQENLFCRGWDVDRAECMQYCRSMQNYLWVQSGERGRARSVCFCPSWWLFLTLFHGEDGAWAGPLFVDLVTCVVRFWDAWISRRECWEHTQSGGVTQRFVQ